jgi:hypothetical protein
MKEQSCWFWMQGDLTLRWPHIWPLHFGNHHEASITIFQASTAAVSKDRQSEQLIDS